MSHSNVRKDSLRADLQLSLAGVVAVMLALYLLVNVATDTPHGPPASIALSFAPAGVLCFAGLLAEMRRRPYSLHLMHLMTVMILLVIAPLVQVLAESFPGAIQVSDRQVLWGNFYVFIWLTSYLGSAAWFRRRIGPVTTPIRLLERTLTLSRLRLGALFGLICLSYLAYRGTAFATTRRAFGQAYSASSTIELGLSIILRSLPMLALGAWLLLVIMFVKRRNWITSSVIALLAASNLIVNNPIAAARVWTLTMLLALACILYLRRQRTGALFVPGALLGLAAFPVLNLGRTQDQLKLNMLRQRRGQGIADSLGSGDFDAFLNLMLTDKYVTEQGITYGNQLLGAALFWVPRRFWEGKPVGSGSHIAEELNLVWDNISSPLPAEALINFGVWGIAPCAFVFAFLLYVADCRYYENRDGCPPDRFRVLDVLYPFWLGLTVFTTRGDLINSATFFAGVSIGAVASLGVFGARSKPESRTLAR